MVKIPHSSLPDVLKKNTDRPQKDSTVGLLQADSFPKGQKADGEVEPRAASHSPGIILHRPSPGSQINGLFHSD